MPPRVAAGDGAGDEDACGGRGWLVDPHDRADFDDGGDFGAFEG